MKIWYFGPLLFFILSLSTLIEERYEVTYESDENKSESKLFDRLVCTPLKEIEIYSNRSEINLHELKNELYKYLNRSMFLDEENKDQFEWSVLNQIKRNNYLIARGQFCFYMINKNDHIHFDRFQHLKNQKDFAIDWDTYYMCKIFQSYVYDILIVFNKAYPYSNCAENYSKFECLNKCFKKKNRLSKYWYSGSETDGIIKLNYDNNNQTLKENEGECFKECKRDDCKLFYIFPIRKLSIDFKFIKASPLIPPFDYWAQLIGLFFLFTNTCFYQIYTQLVNKINLKVKKPKHRRYMTIARYSTLVLVGLGLLALFIVKVINFEKSNPISRITTYKSIESNSFSIVICVDVKTGRNVKLLTLEKKTIEVFNKSFKAIHYEFENKKRKVVDFTLSQKIIFNLNSRCFHLVPHWREIRYQSLFSTSKLIVEFKHRNYLLYLIPDDQNFNSESYQNSLSFNYIKKITRRSKLKNCINYWELNSNFRNRWDSVDRCVSRKYINRTGKISFHSIIDRDHFTDDEWKRAYLDDWNRELYEEIYKECENEIKEEDCYEVKFEHVYKKNPTDNRYIQEIELYPEVKCVIDQDPSIYKLILDMLNILSILFGLNVFQLFHLTYLLTKIKFKGFLIFIYLLCSFGLTYHIFYILNEAINEELIYSQYYEVFESTKMAENIFCFEFSQNMIDKNHKSTGNYLNEITNEMRAETVFEKISYLSKSNEWITLNSTSNYTTDEFKVEIFFFINKKCFKLKQEVEYGQKQLYFEDQKEVLQIYLKSSFIHQEQRVTHLMSRAENTMQFTRNDLDFKFIFMRYTYSIYQELFELTHDDKFNFIKNPLSLLYGENDVNDADRYLKRLTNFKRGLSTLNLPLEEEAFNDEIDDDLFEQYYLQVQNITDQQTPTNSNYKRIFATNYFERLHFVTFKPDISLHLIPIKKRVTITNSDNFTKLTLSLLNAFSIWFGLGVLDLHVYFHSLFHKIKYTLIFFYRLILDFERFILIRLQVTQID